jgi:hypothetical protein
MGRATGSRRGAGSGGRRAPAGVSKRTGLVWSALVASLTLVGGGLWLADGGKAAVAAPLIATTRSVQPIAIAGAGTFEEQVLRTATGVTPARWSAVVIHDSGQSSGTPAALEERARQIGLKGLGHHFVIGNGSGMGDGEIFVGERWLTQAAGAYTAGQHADWFNRHGVGICLVGDGNQQRFTPTQLRQLARLVKAVCARHGIPPERVYLHSQLCNSPSPGRLFSEAQFRAALAE